MLKIRQGTRFSAQNERSVLTLQAHSKGRELTIEMDRMIGQKGLHKFTESEIEEERAAVATGPCTHLCDFKV